LRAWLGEGATPTTPPEAAFAGAARP